MVAAGATLPDDSLRLPHKHRGSPYRHPSGRFIIIIAQREGWTSRALFGAPDYEALPGFGRHDDLWISSADGERSWQLTHDPDTREQGILSPVFFPNGNHIERGSGNPENLGGPRFAGTVSLSSSGEFMLGDVQDDIAKQTGHGPLAACVAGETGTCTCPVLRMMVTQYERLAGFGVATAFEGNGRQGLIDVDLHQIVPGSRVAGPARTVLCGQDDNLMVHAAIERIVPGDVLVVVMPLPTVTSLMGDLLVMQAKRRGVAGIILDGAVRDTEAIRAMNVPVWSRYVRVRTAGKAIPGALDGPVIIGGTTIAPGDAVVLDADGAVAIAAARLEDALAACDERDHKETDLRRQLDAGALTLDLNDLRRLLPG